MVVALLLKKTEVRALSMAQNEGWLLKWHEAKLDQRRNQRGMSLQTRK